MGGACGDLLRQDGRHHLPRRVDGQRALDRDQHIVGGRELGRAPPGQAAAVVAHDALQVLQRQLDIGQHLHGVGCARRRCDGTRRSLGTQHAVRRHDGHDQHGGTVARDAADAVLVHHQALVPIKPLARGHHGVGEEEHFFAVQLVAVARDDEGRELDLGIAVLGDITHDGTQVFAPQALPRDLAEQRPHGFGRLGLRHRHLVASLHTQKGKGVFGQPQLIARDDAEVIHHVQGSQNAPAVGAHLNLGQRLETLRTVHSTVTVQISDVLAPGVDGHTAHRQARD